MFVKLFPVFFSFCFYNFRMGFANHQKYYFRICFDNGR